MNRNRITNNFKMLFEKYPTLKAIPIFAWGTKFKSEKVFEVICKKYCDFKDIVQDNRLNWESLSEIDKKDNLPLIQISREECVEDFGWDTWGGMALLIVKGKKNRLKIQMVTCSSPK